MFILIKMTYIWNKNCRSFSQFGGFACDLMKSEGYKDCSECMFYDKYDKKILIINLGAKGNIIRTTSLLRDIKSEDPNSFIVWVVDEKNKEILEGNKYVDRVMAYNLETVLKLKYEKFDYLYSLDTDAPGTVLASLVDSNNKLEKKYGYYFDERGFTSTFNEEANYYLDIALSDKLTRENRKSFQEMIFKTCEKSFNGEKYIFELSKKAKEYGGEFARKYKFDGKVIGINIGSSPRWPAKCWSKEKITSFIKKIIDETDSKILVLGGPHEIKKQREILDKFSSERIIGNDCNNSYEEFVGVVNLCDAVVTGDTFALHIAIGLNKKTIALFFCTPPWEIYDYGIVKKIASPLLDKYIFTDLYADELANSISVEEVFELI